MKSRESKVLTILSEAEELASSGEECLHCPPDCCECQHDHPDTSLYHMDGEKRVEEPIGCHCVRKGGKCSRYNCLDCLRLDKTEFCAVMIRLQIAEGL